MMGYGSSSSNLSPLAPPFTVDRSTLPKPGTNPLVDLTEPSYPPSLVHSLQEWSNTHHKYFPLSGSFTIPHPDCDPLLPSSVEYSYLPPLSSSSSSTAHVPSGGAYYGESAEVHPYYPPYVSPAFDDDGSRVTNCSGYELLSNSHVVTSMASSTEWSGLWGEGLMDLQPAVGDRSFSTKDDYVNQAFYPSEGLRKYDEGYRCTGVAGSHKQMVSVNEVQVDYKPVLSHSEFISTELTSTPSLRLESVSAMGRTYPQVPSMEELNSRIPEMTYYTPHQQCSLTSDAAPSDTFCVTKPSPSNIGAPIQDACKYSIKKSCSGEGGKEFSGYNPPIFWDSHPFTNSESKVPSDATKMGLHMEEKCHNAADFLSANIEGVPSGIDVSKDGFDINSAANSVSHVSSLILGDFSLNINEHKAVDSTEDFPKNVDLLNPAVDSPCWRGAPVPRVSPFFEASDAVFPQDMGKLDFSNGLSVQTHVNASLAANDELKGTVQLPNERSLHCDNSVQENVASSAKRSSVANMMNGEETDAAVNPKHQYSNCPWVQTFNALHEHGKENAVSESHQHDSDLEVLNGGGPAHGERGASEKHLGHGVIDADVALNNNLNLENHPSFSCIGQAKHSQSSVEDASSKINGPYCQELTSKICFATVLDTLHDLSEVLLFHCLDGKCELKEEERVALKDVINNLNACVLKKVERLAPMEESMVPQDASSAVVGSQSNLQKGIVKDRLVQEGKDNIVSGSEDAKLSNDIVARSLADMLKQENITQGIRKVLAANFPVDEELLPETLLYKNLWLEAEASLCSVNYMARYNRLKTEVDKLSTDRGTGNQSNSQVSPMVSPQTEELTANRKHDLAPIRSAILNANNTDDVVARDFSLKLQEMCSNSASSLTKGQLPSSSASTNLNKVDKLACEAKELTELSAKDSPLSSATSHAADDHASVIARFNILKDRIDKSSHLDTETKETFSNSPSIPDLNKVDPLTNALEDVTKTNPEIDHLPVLSTSSFADDVGASVMARFNILKHRDGLSSPISKEDRWLEDDGLVGGRWMQPVGGDLAKDKIPDVEVDQYINVPGLCKVDQTAIKVKDAAVEDPPNMDLPILRFRKDEASLMPRSHVLKLYDDYGSGYIGSTRNRMSEGDGMIDVKVEPAMQVPHGSYRAGEGSYKEFYLFANDDPVTQSPAGNQADQPNAGGSDGFYSDWEHVLKEEFAGQR